MTTREMLIIAAFGALGVLVGWLYFALMQYSLARLNRTTAGIGQFVAIVFVRLALFTGGVFAAIWAGNAALLAYVVAFIVARMAAVARARVRAQAPGEPPERRP